MIKTLVTLILIIGMTSATIVPMDRYTLDTGDYSIYDGSVSVSLKTPPNNGTYIVEMEYPESDPEIKIWIIEHNSSVSDPISKYLKYINGTKRVDKPYPGLLGMTKGIYAPCPPIVAVMSKENLIVYAGVVSNKTDVIVATSNINLASFLLKNLMVLTNTQAEEKIATDMAKELSGD